MRNRSAYPANWLELARACKERAGGRCQFCQVEQGTRVKGKYTGLWYRVALHAAHRDHDKGNPQPELLALCPSCHGRYDWQWRVRLAWVDLERLKHCMRLAQWRRQEQRRRSR